MTPANWILGISTAGALSAAFYAGTLANRIDANERAINDLRTVVHELAVTVSAASLAAATTAANVAASMTTIDSRLQRLENARGAKPSP